MGNVRYIGKTDDTIYKRLSDHINDSKNIINGIGRKKINKRFSWIISLLNKGELPIVVELEKP